MLYGIQAEVGFAIIELYLFPYSKKAIIHILIITKIGHAAF